MAETPPLTPRTATTPHVLPQQYSLPLDDRKLRDGLRTATEGVSRVRSTPKGELGSHLLSSHKRHIVDFDTGGEVTPWTRLHSLYQYTDKTIDNVFLQNVTGKSSRVLAQMLVKADGKYTAYPPSLDADYKYRVYARFNTLYSAPAVRVEFEFFDSERSNLSYFGALALEYPFNDRDGKQLRNFVCDAGLHTELPLTICFDANGATSDGLTNVDAFADRLTAEQKLAVAMVKAQSSTRKGATIVLSVQTQELEDRQRPTYDQVLQQLPGGKATVLPSFGETEWSDFLADRYSWKEDNKREVVQRHIPNLRLVQDCDTTFSSLEHFCTVHQVAEVISNEEGTGELRIWANSNHQVSLHELKGHVVLAMRFGPSRSRRLARNPKLPNDLEIRIKLSAPGLAHCELIARHERDLMGPHVQYDAVFKVTSHSLEELSALTHQPDERDPMTWRVTSLIPHENRFWVASVHKTCKALRADSRWHAFMLGQSFESLKKIDAIAAIEGVSDNRKASAIKWLLELMRWNTEQRQVIESMREALGGVVLCTGFSGTGKTTLLLASAVYFVKLGGRAIISATENGHIENMAKILDSIIANTTRPDGKPIEVYIVQSLSRNRSLHRTTAAQAALMKVGHIEGRAAGFENYRLAELDDETEQDSVAQYNLCVAVAREADIGRLKFATVLRDSKGNDYGTVEVWGALRKLRLADSKGELDRRDKKLRIFEQLVYNACEGYLVAHADMIITTAGNARCKELDAWGDAERNHDVHVKALGVFIDNADSCRAMEFWNVVTSSALPRDPDLVMVAGDVRVLGPVNTSINQAPLCNPFAASMSMSELERLYRLHFPIVELTEQRFMNPELLRYPSSAFYGNELRTPTDRDRPFDPQLLATLLRILSQKKYRDPEPATLGNKACQCWIELPEEEVRVETNDRNSIVVLDFVEIFFTRIFPALQEHFGERTSQKVMVVVAYSYARTKYTECMHGLQQEQGLDDLWYPRIVSVDGSKGHTATVAFFDGSMQYGDRMGFLKDAKRCNVAMTRATEVFWVIGCSLLTQRNDANQDAPFYRLREQLLETGQVMEFAVPELETIDRLTAKGAAPRAKPSQLRNVALRPKKSAFRR